MSADALHLMETLHAYWRMEYVTAPKKSAGVRRNPFTELPSSGDDRKALILHRGTEGYLILNRYPYNPGHIMAVPYREVAALEDLSVSERAELTELIVRAKSLLSRTMNPDGFNIGLNEGSAAGAGIAGHLHWHIVPRWTGDHNFMPVTGSTRVLPQALEETWEALRSVPTED